MASVDMCQHNWPGSGCPDCRATRRVLHMLRASKDVYAADPKAGRERALVQGLINHISQADQ